MLEAIFDDRLTQVFSYFRSEEPLWKNRSCCRFVKSLSKSQTLSAVESQVTCLQLLNYEHILHSGLGPRREEAHKEPTKDKCITWVCFQSCIRLAPFGRWALSEGDRCNHFLIF